MLNSLLNSLSSTPHEAHVWHTSLLASPEVLPQLQAALSQDERARAARFKFERDRQRYECAHAALRIVLARYAHYAPNELQFGANAFGKPHLTNAVGLHFNLSHSHDAAVIAVAHTEIGIDIEAVRPLDDLLNMAQQFFCADEAEALQQLPPAAQTQAFYRIWTRKEAYLKAIGTGLSTNLNEIRVPVGEQAQVGVWEPLTARLHVRELEAPLPYVCALVAGTVVQSVRRFTFAH